MQDLADLTRSPDSPRVIPGELLTIIRFQGDDIELALISQCFNCDYNNEGTSAGFLLVVTGIKNDLVINWHFTLGKTSNSEHFTAMHLRKITT